MKRIIVVRGGPDGVGKGPTDSVSVLLAEELNVTQIKGIEIVCFIQKLEETSKLSSVKRISPPFSDEIPYSKILRECKTVPYPSFDKVEVYLKYYPTYDRIMDRMFKTENIDAYKRRKIFWWLINFSEQILFENEPTDIVFTVIPHFAFDFVFYFTAHEAGVRVLAFEHVISSKYTRLVNVYNRLNKDTNNIICNRKRPLKEEDHVYIKEYVEARRKDYVLPDYLERQYSLSSRYFCNIILFAVNLVKILIANLLIIFDKEQDGKYLQKKDSLFLLTSFFKAGKQRKKYEKVSIKDIPSKPYVLFALHDEPEMVLVPMCSPFDDQIAFAISLAKRLKVLGIQLVLREHPLMFNKYRTKLRRNSSLYKDVSTCENIFWATDSIDSRTWVKRSVGVVTGTGNIGLEAAILGLPVLNFGRPWYKNIYSIYEINEMDAFFEELTNNNAKESEELQILEGCKDILANSVPAISDSTTLDYQRLTNDEKKENAKLLAVVITEFLVSERLDLTNN